MPVTLRAQLVSDGQTAVLNGVITNFSGGVTIGTNAPFTTLIVTNGAAVTNSSGNTIIGLNAPASSNLVVVTGLGSSLSTSGLLVGQSGPDNELEILNGGVVSGGGGIGNLASSSNNLVVISGAGSLWSPSNLTVGNGGGHNSLVLTNGGQIQIGNAATIGDTGLSSTNNSVLITGAGSQWNSGYVYLGYMNPGKQRLSITNGGSFLTSSTCDVGVYCNSNVLSVSDPGSSLQCSTFRMGYASVANQCIVSNGATLSVSNASSSAATVEGAFTSVAISGAGSVWTNNVDFDFGGASNTLFITAGGKLADDDGYIEGNTGNNPQTNTVVVAGANSVWTNVGNLYIADSGAQLFITNGARVVDQNGYVGENAGNNNCYVLVSGPGSVWTNRNAYLDGNNEGSLVVGSNGATNLLVITDFGKVAAPDIYVNNNSKIIVTNSGVLLAVRDIWNGSSGGLDIGNNSSPNQLIVSDAATVIVGGILQIGNFSGGTSNTLTINGGTIIVSNGVTVGDAGSLVLNSGLFQGGTALFSIYNYAAQTNSIVLNSGTLQSGGIFYGFEAFPVPLTVGDGVDPANFQMLNSGNLNGGVFGGGFVVSSNGWLAGAGTVNGSITIQNGGNFAPGTNELSPSVVIGSLTVSGSLNLSNGSTTVMGLLPQSVQANSVQGLTNVVYGGTLQLTNLGGMFAAGQTYQLFSASNYAGAFSNLLPSAPGNGLRWDTWELNVNGTLRVFSSSTPPPIIGGLLQANGALSISATGGIPYDPCYILTSTNLAAPVWTRIGTNYFDMNGDTGFTNAIPGAEPQRFFELEAN